MEWCGGQWSNENILQLLSLFKQEPCLWDPRTRNYKNRSAHAFAWDRILSKLPFKTTLDEVKKKKNSLMGYYRIHLNRYKKTLSITGGSAVYQTTWFAFELMHSFLRPIYGPKKKKTTLSPASTTGDGETTVKSETRSESEESEYPDIYADDDKKDFSLEINEDPLRAALYPEVNVNEGVYMDKPELYAVVRGNEVSPLSNLIEGNEKVAVINEETSEKFDAQCIPEKSKKSYTERDCPKKNCVKRDKRDSMDEYDHFGFMLASKIRRINSTPEREILMNSIQNLVFETYMKCRQNNSQDT